MSANAFERVGCVGISHPGHEADVVLVEAVVHGALDGASVDRPTSQQLADLHGQHCAAVAQPAVSGLPVGREYLLDDLVDVGGDDFDHLEGGQPFEVLAWRLAQQLLDAVAEEAGLADPVGADEEGGRYVLLCEPAGVVHRGGRSDDRRRLVEVDERRERRCRCSR